MKPDQSPTVEGQNNDDNLSVEQLIAQRLEDQSQADTESEPEEATSEADEDEEVDDELEESDELEATEDEEAEEGADDDDDEESDSEDESIDLLELEPEQILDLAKKAKSRLLKDVGKLRATNRQLEERLASLEQQGTASNAKEIPTESNPFGKLTSQEEIQKKFDELETTLETTDRLLEDHEEYGPDDEIEVSGKVFTKRQIRTANRNAREALTKYLPAQQKHVAKLIQLDRASEQYRAQAEKEVPEIKDDKSDIGKNYQVLVSDPLIKQVKQKVPELGFQMEYILAHAARSIFGKAGKIQNGAGKRLKTKLSASPEGSVSGSKKSSQQSKVDTAFQRYQKTGSTADWQAYRLAQMGQ